MQHRNRTDNANAARDPSRGNALVGPPDLAIFSSSYGYCECDPEFDERANLVTGDDPECIDTADQSAFMSLFGLSATSVMRAELLWDAENRLAAYIPLNSWSGAGVPARSRLGASKVTFKYDYRGRRIEKNVYAWNSGAGAWYGDAYPTERRRFIWSGAGVPARSRLGASKVTFKYDYRGRRIEKNVYAWNSGAGAWYGDAYPIERLRFIWSGAGVPARGRLAGVPAGGWLMLRETIETDSASDGTFEATRIKTNTWGKDLSGAGVPAGNSLESAGGIGGLLAVYDDSATSGTTGDDLAYVYMYDANGNVGQVCDLTQSTAAASIVAKYEYDAYGNATVSSGSYATANTYRFSTKPWDDETGLGYWGYRYYDPRLGRWMSRDPLDELGGACLYTATLNNPVNDFDPLGDISWACIICYGSLLADYGGGIAGCLWGCAEAATPTYGVHECFWDCVEAYLEDRTDINPLNLYKNFVEGASCNSCGVKKPTKQLTRDRKGNYRPRPGRKFSRNQCRRLQAWCIAHVGVTFRDTRNSTCKDCYRRCEINGVWDCELPWNADPNGEPTDWDYETKCGSRRP